MRPYRLLLSVSFSLVAGTLLLYLALASPQDEQFQSAPDASNKGAFRALFSFTSPGSLFPPSAIISLTDDNSTFFLARPAAFGSTLPKGGLSGPLWIGSGFGDDIMGHGELGCSDVPGWEDDDDDTLLRASTSSSLARSKSRTKEAVTVKGIVATEGDILGEDASTSNEMVLDDGTDDHLQRTARRTTQTSDNDHADIQSLQESAEMAGKVALLRRGGCGFLAKVQWAQKRGATAVIVGDDVRGGALIRMYAKGDTSNITIPSLFTSHTTAHLLSSLLPAEGSLQDTAAGDKVKATDASKKTSATREKPGKSPDIIGRRSSTNKGQEATQRRDQEQQSKLAAASKSPDSKDKSFGWLHFLLPTFDFGDGSSSHPKAGSGRLPDSSNVLPGSGEYVGDVETDTERKVWWNKRSGMREATTTATSNHAIARSVTSITGADLTQAETSSLESNSHQGLWVTLTPTNISTSPFFDTLLVLVVSPLVTLTVVYALLLLRSRIRRRRWRAPKSVVERLPVRTYQTISESSSSATLNASSPTTPLLQHSPSPSTSTTPHAHSEPQLDVPTASSSPQQESRDREEEKRESGLAAWRRRYGGRQKECVVCLEEYEDGVSQVMSLPCGHEFHADCITPWLVTRRRTCPICKGDVVRSLSQSYHDRLESPSRFTDREDDVQTQAAETRNDSPSASRPVPMPGSASTEHVVYNDDIESGWPREGTRQNAANGPTELSSSLREMSSTVSTVIWRGFEAVRNSTTSGLQRRPPLADVDRNR